MIDWLTEPFALGFMQRALIASIIVGVVCAVLGCYVVLRSMAFLGDALAHAILPGVAVAYLLGANLLAGALVAGLIVAVGISYVSKAGAVREDTAIGIFFAAALALGVVLISTMRTYAVDLTHVLFGNVLGVTATDVWITGGLAFLVLAAILLLYRRLLVVSFDPILGQTLGLRTHALQTVLFLMLAATIVVALQTVGVALVAAMLITPPAAAYLLTRRLPVMMLVSALHRGGVLGRGPLRQLLPRRSFGRRDRSGGDRHIRARVPLRARTRPRLAAGAPKRPANQTAVSVLEAGYASEEVVADLLAQGLRDREEPLQPGLFSRGQFIRGEKVVGRASLFDGDRLPAKPDAHQGLVVWQPSPRTAPG